MIEFIEELNINEMIAGGAGIAVIINLILSKLKLTPKIEAFFNWLQKKLAGLKNVVHNIGNNFGVLITTKVKKIPVIGIIWESGLEPLLILVCQLMRNVVIATAGLAIEFLKGIVEGLKTDNNNYNKLNEEAKE